MANKKLIPAFLKEAKRFLKVRYGAMFSDMSGAIGGGVVAKNKGGAYMRRRVKPINPSSPYSANVRNIFTSISTGWASLSDSERDSWVQGAKQHSVPSALGESVFMSGKAWYQRLNQNLLLIGEAQINTFPTLIAVPSFDISNVVADESAQSVIITFSPTVPTDTVYAVYATPQLSPGIQSMGVRDRSITQFAAAQTSPQTVSSSYLARFPAALVLGQRIFVKIVAISTVTGQAGIPVIFSTKVVA